MLAGVLSLWLDPTSLRSQDVRPLEQNQPPGFLDFLNSDGCIPGLPAPLLIAEPRFTQGTRNVVAIKLPPLSSLPFSADTIRSPIIITLVNSGVTATLQFPRPVQLGEDITELETVTVLVSGRRYSYTTALFLPICKIPCSAVTDTSQLELHCSAYEDTTWSTQDVSSPLVSNIRIPELGAAVVPGWLNRPALRVEAEVNDPAGVWQAFLYQRSCGQSGWNAVAGDTTFTSQLDSLGFIFSESAHAVFAQNLPDGCYEFRVEAKDGTHTPESFAPNFELAGNGGVPAGDASAQVRINIDTTPPDSVALTAEQVFNNVNLSWTMSIDPVPGIGLAGYRIYRDGELIHTVANDSITFVDAFAMDAPSDQFVYQIQPYDSLDNVQSLGGTIQFQFVGLTRILMVPEPEFTSGSENQICWNGSDIVDSYFIYIAADCDFTEKAMFNVTDTCFTFSDLQDGVAYCYWIEAFDRQQRPVFSDTVRSTQDASSPAIAALRITDQQEINSNFWTSSPQVQIELSANDDAPGRISFIRIFENDQLAATVTPPDPPNPIPIIVGLTLTSAECQETEIRAIAEDGAGNFSVPNVIKLKLDSTAPPRLAFLNGGQLLQSNGIRLEWGGVSDASGCSGLAGYQVLRNGIEIRRVHPDSLGYSDFLSNDTPSGQFRYEVLPFDSLENQQTDGPVAVVDYLASPSITIESLAEFTPGLTNEVCWSVVGSLVELKLFVDSGCDSLIDLTLDIADPAAPSQCQQLAGLSDGQRYCYWLEGKDAQQRRVVSAVVTSTQDNTPPTVDMFLFPAGDSLNDQVWAFERRVGLQLVAHDPAPGEIWRFEIIEGNFAAMEFDNPDSSRVVNRAQPYDIRNEDTQPATINLRARAYDGAGNVSTEVPLLIYFQEDAPSIYAYPNPFNPMNKKIVIRIRDERESEVKIYDFFGNLVRTITEKENDRDFFWDGLNGLGEMVANGGYICVGSRTKARFKIGVVKRN
jgi:hypothetical protein